MGLPMCSHLQTTLPCHLFLYFGYFLWKLQGSCPAACFWYFGYFSWELQRWPTSSHPPLQVGRERERLSRSWAFPDWRHRYPGMRKCHNRLGICQVFDTSKILKNVNFTREKSWKFYPSPKIFYTFCTCLCHNNCYDSYFHQKNIAITILTIFIKGN